MMPGSVVGCARNMLRTMVFIRFRSFTHLMNLVVFDRLLGVFCFDNDISNFFDMYLVNVCIHSRYLSRFSQCVVEIDQY